MILLVKVSDSAKFTHLSFRTMLWACDSIPVYVYCQIKVVYIPNYWPCVCTFTLYIIFISNSKLLVYIQT